MRRLLVLLAAVTLIGAASLAPSAASARQPHVFPPTAHAFGASLGEWQARWFTWFIEIPAPTNPLSTRRERSAGSTRADRSGSWHRSLHPGLTTRACTVPVGKGIFVLGLGNECSNIEPPPFFGATEAELRACAADGVEEFFGDATQSISVDGVEVADLGRYRTQTPLFSYTLPPDNVYGLPPVTATKAISDGTAVIVQPLPKGQHQIVVHLEAPVLGGTTNIIYNLTVVTR